MSSILLTVGILVGGIQTAHAQFPINESFTAATTAGFTLGGSARLTGTATAPGYLQLTPNTNNQAGYAILNGSFASPQGFSISFEFFSYANNVGGADGFSVFMIDANGTDPKVAGQFKIGGSGGSLGYAQNTNVAADGVTKGYIGIGIDEFGNYSNPTEGRVGGPGAVRQAVAIRGPGAGTNGYEYLTGTGTLPFSLSVPTTRAQPGNDDYRKAYIYVVPSNGAYKVTVRIQHGNTITTTTDSYTVPTPPTNLRIGFSGSTGGNINVHEIRNLAIVDNPFAQDDLASTPFNTAVNINVLANDQGIGNPINPATVDLDPTTAGIQSTLTVAGQGTFTVNNQGVVTFTPSGTFVGRVIIPYVVSDLLNQVSNVVNISVLVLGADVATGVSGPTSAIPGAQVTYTVSNTNIGSETATNLIPTLRLPTGLTVPASANYTYDSGSGLVTFNQVTLAQNASVENSVTFRAPASGPVTVTAGFTYPTGATVPDPTPGNNTAAVTTNITGSSTLATDCAVPGKDGVGALSSTSTPNTYYPGSSISTANGVSTISVGTATGGTTPVAVGDLVMVVQMQGATMDVTNTTAYGSVSNIAAGQYEYAAVGSVSGSPVATITLTKTLANTYINNAGNNQNFQVIRVPQYASLTVTGIVTGAAWNSQSKVGGVLALDVAGRTTFTGTTPGLSMTAKGFNGGGGVAYTTSTALIQTVYASTATAGGHGSKGESIAGTPLSTYNGTAVTTATIDGYATGSSNRGAPANGGGGAQDFTPATNSGNSGGGGGGNGGVGGLGGYGFGSISTGNRAIGGRAFSSSGTRITMGGGGGAGSSNSVANAQLSSGGVGGGIIILRTGSVSGTARLQADGSDAPSPTTGDFTEGGGGGGAGGTVLVLATPPTGVASGLTNVTASATGGNGGSANATNGGAAYGPGGSGGGGVVLASAALNAASSVATGLNGRTNNGNGNRRDDFGATVGDDGVSSPNTSAASTRTIGGASSCLPVLTVALSTLTPNVTRTSNRTPTPATYTAVISNTGGTAQDTRTTMTLDPLFTYDNTYTPVLILTTASGAATTLPSSAYTVTGTTAPVFSGVTIPSGATLRITFRSTIASTAVNSTIYQASAAVAFLDPTRTVATNTATPGNTFNGGGTVPGTNYAAASSTREDVAIVAPLPVELTSFEVAAVRQDAVLAWATASEKNNDRFVVERSFTGYGFTAIGTVRGQGNSTRTTTYAFTDRGAGRLAAETIYYRLQQVDADGTASYSPVRTVQFAAVAKAKATLYPNPSQDKTTVDLTGLAAGTYSVQVLDLAGRVLRTQQSGAEASVLDLQGLPQGAYIVLVRGAGVNQALPLIRN